MHGFSLVQLDKHCRHRPCQWQSSVCPGCRICSPQLDNLWYSFFLCKYAISVHSPMVYGMESGHILVFLYQQTLYFFINNFIHGISVASLFGVLILVFGRRCMVFHGFFVDYLITSVVIVISQCLCIPQLHSYFPMPTKAQFIM